MDVLVFKTSVSKPKQINKVEKLLNVVPAIKEWNFDLDDCDNILRIVANNLSPRTIQEGLRNAGIDCRELA